MGTAKNPESTGRDDQPPTIGELQPADEPGKKEDGEAKDFSLPGEQEELNLPAICHYLKLYPCWLRDGCPACMHRSPHAVCAKPCWKEEGTFCQAYVGEDTCSACEFRKNSI